MSYQGPSWAVAPVDQNNNNNNNNNPSSSSSSSSSQQQQQEWILIEIKSGVEVARHNLSSRPFTLIGRDADACPIVLQHESCSRLHARIAFDGGMTGGGVPWLRDLQSTHGTTVNKKKLPPMACGKLESTSTKIGARGVVLYPSDVLQFGASTRIYCLEGPGEFARGAKKLLQKQQEAANRLMSGGGGDSISVATGDELMKQQQQQDKEKDETGIDMDDHHDDSQMDENDKSQRFSLLLPANLDESKIPEKHRKEWDRLRALRYKLENVQEESGRILRKGREDLTEGQERQLLRNQERAETLKLEIQEKEAVLHRKLFPDKVAASQRQSRDRSAYAEEDEVEDRTGDEARRIQEGLLVVDDKRSTTSSRGNNDDNAEDEQSLRAKRSLLLEKQRAIQARMAQAQEKTFTLQARIHRLQAAGDGEECFFVQNDLDIANDSLSKSQKEQAAVDKLLAQTERLLKIVNPKIDCNEASISSSSSTFIAVATAPTTTTTTITADPTSAAELMPAPSIMPASLAKKRKQSPPLVDTGDATYGAVAARDSGCIETISLPPPPSPPPPPKRPRVLGPSMPPPPSMSTKGTTGSTQIDKQRPRPKGSTLDVLSASLSTTTTTTALLHVPKKYAQKGTQPSKTTTNSVEKPSVALTMDDEKHDQWVKPKDQDGSGMTNLNKKFAGRY